VVPELVKIGAGLSDQKARCFFVLFAFKRLFLEHAYKMFGEMIVRI
jgi:hypothetical protein